MQNKEYIWHCPTDSCKQKGIILFKTNSIAFGEGQIKCHECGQTYRFSEIMKHNIKNIMVFVKELTS